MAYSRCINSLEKIYKYLIENKSDNFNDMDLNFLRQTIMGLRGEEIIRGYLGDSGFKYQQIDILSSKDGNYYLNEVKYKEMFKGYPGDGSFDGHGLSLYQAKDRLSLCKTMKIDGKPVTPLLWVIDPENGILYNDLNKLHSSKKFITKNNIVIYPLENFKKLNIK